MSFSRATSQHLTSFSHQPRRRLGQRQEVPGSASLQREKRCKGSGSCSTNRRAATRVKHGAGTWLHSAKQDSGVFNEVSFGRIFTARTLTYDEAVSSAQRLSTTACPELGCGKALPSADPQYVRVGRQRHPANSPSRTRSNSQYDGAGLSRRGRSRGSNRLHLAFRSTATAGFQAKHALLRFSRFCI